MTKADIISNAVLADTALIDTWWRTTEGKQRVNPYIDGQRQRT